MHYKLLLAVLSFGSMNAMEMEVDKESTQSSTTLTLLRDQYGFYIAKNEYPYAIESYNVDPKIKEMTSEQIVAFLESGCSISVHEIGEDEYELKAHVPGVGGGVFGAVAGSALGYGGVTLAGHSVIEGIAWCTGPFYLPVAGTLHKMLAIPIHSAACSAGVALGMVGAVVTGLI